MRFDCSSAPGGLEPNEDFFTVSPSVGVIVDGATARGDTGCRHGVAWYAAQLGSHAHHLLLSGAALPGAVAAAITAVTDSHRGSCDVDHPGTPSAAIGLVRVAGGHIEWCVLGDVVILLDTADGLRLATDTHDHVAAPERQEADRYAIGTPEKTEALVRMKQVETAARNTPGGFWVAATAPEAADHAKHGKLPADRVSRILMLTDGAARLVSDFDLAEWVEVLTLVSDKGTAELIRLVREAEEADPAGTRWPRNKKSDDATAVLLTL